MIKKHILLLVVSALCLAGCSPGDDSESPNDNDTDNDTVIVEQLSTNQGFANDIVSIEGANFLAQVSTITVRLSSTVADIITVTNDRIDFRIPSNLQETTHSVTLILAETSFDLGLFNILSDTKLLAASSNGKFYELGALSGNATQMATTAYTFLSAFVPVNILKQDNMVYFFDTYSPGLSTLVKHNLITNSSEFEELVFPSEIIGNEPGIIAFEYDTATNMIIAVINENVIFESQDLNYVVTIDPNTYQVSYTGISFNQISINSTLLKNNKLFLASTDESYEFSVVDLATQNVETVELSSDYKITQLGHLGDNIYAMRSGISIIGGISPISIDPNSYEVSLFQQDNNLDYALTSFFGNSFVDDNLVYSVITSSSFSVGILVFNSTSNTYSTKGLNGSFVESNLKILDLIN